MSNFVMLVACLLVGLLLQRSRRLPENAHVALNGIILHVSLPAVTLRYLHDFSFEMRHLLPVLMPWMLFLLGAALFWTLGRALRLPAASVGALTLVGGLGNTSFVGLPMIEALHGRDGLALGLVIDQFGSYLALSTVGIGAAAVYAADGPVGLRDMARKVMTFPPFIALLAALLLSPMSFPPVLDHALARVGDTLAPLALLSVGLQLRFDALREHRRLLCLGLGYKLVVCPALVLALLWLLGAGSSMISHVSLIEAAMPPMIGAAIVASQTNLAPRLVSMMVGLGIPLGLLTVSGWFWLFGALARGAS
jgi:predicted permease